MRVLRRDYGKPGLSVKSIAAKVGRTPNQIMCKAAGLGLKWPLEFRANLGSEPPLTDLNAEARRLIYLLTETGLRLSEAGNLPRTTIRLDAPVPHTYRSGPKAERSKPISRSATSRSLALL